MIEIYFKYRIRYLEENNVIKNQWYVVLDSKELKKNKPIGVTRFSQKLVFWRDELDNISFIFDKCCHRGASLALGKFA